jgi:hypothetical protein
MSALDAEHLPDDYNPGALRLRARTRWASVALALITLLPYEIIDGHPQFLWHLMGELPPAGLVAYLAPLFAGLSLWLLGRRATQSSTLGYGTLAVLATTAAVVKLGADASAWEVMSLPDSLSQRVALPVLALALTGAGAALTFRAEHRRGGHGLLLAGLLTALAFYLWPTRSEAPGHTLYRLLSQLDTLPHWRFMVGYGVLALLLAWPLLVALLGLWHLKRPASDDQPVLTIVAQYGLPLMLGMLIFRALPGAPEGWDVFSAAGSIVVLIGVVTLLTSGFEVAATVRPSARLRAILLSSFVVLSGAQAFLARPPSKGVHWAEGSASAAADTLFADLLPRWNRARLRWDRRARGASAAQARLEVLRQGRLAIDAAKALHPALGEAVQALTRGARSLHVAGRTWHALVEGVNAASRSAGLPYYLDPSVIMFGGEGTRRRHFRMRSYRVERVRRFDVAGDAFATLHVKRLDHIGPDQPLLGFSRDLQPFALINLEEVRSFEAELSDGAAERPPNCVSTSTLFALPGKAICSRVLGRVVTAHQAELGTLVATLTDRHELQHQIDGPHLPMASAVLDALAGKRSQAFMDRVNRELSAYTAELTATDSSPSLGLVHLFRFALSGDGQDLDHIARLILGELTGLWLYTDAGKKDWAALTEAMSTLAALDDDTLRLRAHAAWESFYGHALPELREVPAP